MCLKVSKQWNTRRVTHPEPSAVCCNLYAPRKLPGERIQPAGWREKESLLLIHFSYLSMNVLMSKWIQMDHCLWKRMHRWNILNFLPFLSLVLSFCSALSYITLRRTCPIDLASFSYTNWVESRIHFEKNTVNNAFHLQKSDGQVRANTIRTFSVTSICAITTVISIHDSNGSERRYIWEAETSSSKINRRIGSVITLSSCWSSRSTSYSYRKESRNPGRHSWLVSSTSC